ncbi:MAG: ABC transporter permease [Planctomycetes bacterium]|nr:ABC transporter permease [Planctomycetota bacterium]
MFGLGIAFRSGADQEVHVDVVAGSRAEEARAALGSDPRFQVAVVSPEEAKARFASGKTDVIVEGRGEGYRYVYDPSRTGAEAARIRVNDALQAAAGRRDPVPSASELITEPGSRYIDWLIPGLLGMNIMGGGLWGLGFVTVDMRMRKLLKRFVATPMRRSDFLLALMASRLMFLVTEIGVILAVGCLAFGLQVKGSLLALAVVILVGAASFAGLGLLVASRTDKIETVSGLLNLVMLPMWLLSGIFFSAERFPGAMQPLVQALPLTQLNNALRAVILEGAPLGSQWLPVAALAAYGILAFGAALRMFKWQ